MSGYTEDAFTDGTGLGGAKFLQKPFTAQALAMKLREALAEKAGGAA